MVFKNICVLLLWTKVASALEGLTLVHLSSKCEHQKNRKIIEIFWHFFKNATRITTFSQILTENFALFSRYFLCVRHIIIASQMLVNQPFMLINLSSCAFYIVQNFLILCILSLLMLRLLSSKLQGRKYFRKPLKPCHVGIHWNALTEYFHMSTHLPGFQSFFRFFASFCIGQISHQQHKGYSTSSCIYALLMCIWIIKKFLKRVNGQAKEFVTKIFPFM